MPGLNQATFTKCINRSYVDDFLHAQLPDVTKFEPNCSGYVDLDVGAIFNPLPELMIAGNQLNSRQSKHKQIAFNGIINVSENTTQTCLYKVFDKPFTITSVFTKFCPKNSHDDMDITVLALGLLLCCLFYSLEPLLYVQPFNDTSNKQKRQVIKPCISEGDNLPPAEKIAYVDCSTSEKSELSTSSTLQVSCHKNTSERQDERNEKKIPVNNDRRLPCCYRSLNSNPKKADIKYLRIFGFIAFLFSMFFLINSISVNGFNISKHTSSKAHINFIPVIAQNISLFKSDHCVVDEYLASALPQDLNPQCKVQHCATNNTPLYNSEICEDSSSNYSTRLINEEDSIYRERHTSLVQLAQCLPDPFLCSHYTHAVCRFVNTSGVKPIKLHQNDQLVVRQDDVSLSNSVVHNNYLSYMEHPRYRLVNQSTNITLSLSYNYHLPLTNNILNVAPSSSTSLLGITTVEDMQPVLLHFLATLPAALPCNSFTQSNQTLFTGKRFTDMPIKSEILIPSRITGTLELKGEQCFDKVIASSSTIHFLSNSNNTCYKFLYGALDKYTHVVINFDRLTDAILSKPLNATSIVSLQSIDNIFPLVLHNNSNVMVNVVIMIKFLNIVKSKFKSMTMQCQLQNPIPFVVLCIYICVKWIIIIALTSIKQKLLLLTQCCNLYLKKLQRPLVRASNIYCLKNPTSFCKVNQHVLFCKQQQVWFIDLTKHRHFSNAWCKKCQENLSRPCIIGFKVALNNLLGFCDIISVKSSFVLIKQITCNKASNLLVFLQLLIDGRRVHISSSIAALKNYSMPIILFGKLTKLPKVLSLTKHSSLASTVCQVDNSAQLSNILHAHYFESQWCYSDVEWTKSMIISIIYRLHPMQTIYVISGLQKTSLFLQINEVTNEATQACAMHVVYIMFNYKGQRRCNTKDHILSTTNEQYRNVNNYIHNMRQLQEDDSIEVIHGGLPKSDHHMHDNRHNSDQHDNDDNHNINRSDQDGDHYDDQNNHTLDDDNYDHDTNNNNGDHAENDDDDHHDNHGNNHDDEHDDNGYDHNDDHTDNHNDDCNHDNHGDDHDDNDYDHADDDDDDHNDDDDDNHCNNDEDNNDQDRNVAKFIILAFSYCFLMLLLLLYRLFLVSCHIFVWQILRFCNWIMHLLSGRTRLARIDNQSHGYTFMPNRRHKLVHVLNTKTTAIDRSHHPYIYRDRYSQVYAKLLIYIGFQLSPLYSNEATNFQVSRFVNLMTYIRNDLQFSNNSLQIFHRGDGPIMLLSSGHLMCISIYIQARENSQLSLLPFGCHKVLVTVLTFCQVGYGRSQFNIIAMRFEDLNITEIVRWLCMNQYFLWNCNHFVSLQLFRISDELPSQKQLTLQEIDNCTPYSTKKNELQNCIYLAKISVRNLIDCLEEHLFANFYSFLRLQFTNEDLLQSIFFTNLRALYPAMIAKRHVMFLHNISQLVIGDRQKKLYLEAIQVVLERVIMPAGAIILIKPTIAYNLLDLSDDGADVVEMVTGCTLRILGESMANESGIKLVLHHVTYNICIHQPAQRKLSIDSLPDHGRDLLIKKDHVLWFLPVNPPLCHQYLLGGDSKDPDVNVSYV